MDLVPVQYCQSTSGWSPVQIQSKSKPGLFHTVLVSPFVTKGEFVCDCPGFEFRGGCRHQREALDHVCWWPMVHGDLVQSDEERKAKQCPHCGGPTRWEMIDAEET